MPHPRLSEFLSLTLANRWNALILERMPRLGVADAWLVSGCVVQPVWNARAGRPADQDILDYDLFYFDADTGWEAEDAVIRRAASLFADLPVEIQVRNQARVPVWFPGKFGIACPPVTRASDGIDRFPCATTCIGLRPCPGGIAVHAPHGLDLALDGILAPNPVLPIPDRYAEKVARWTAVWPFLTVVPWPSPIRTPGSASGSGLPPCHG